MLRIAGTPPQSANALDSHSNTTNSSAQPHFLSADKKKRQVTLTDPTSISTATATQERGPMVAAPKMFAFDGMFTSEDTQAEVCASALSEVIPAVLEGSDACLLTLGYPAAGKSLTFTRFNCVYLIILVS